MGESTVLVDQRKTTSLSTLEEWRMGEPWTPCLPIGGAFSLFTGDLWSVGDQLLPQHLPQQLCVVPAFSGDQLFYWEANCQQTLDQPWDLTLFDGAEEDNGMGRI